MASHNDGQGALIKEIREKLPHIDVEGLEFLNKQADILIYNARVEALNKKIPQRIRPAAFVGPTHPDIVVERTGEDTFYIVAGREKIIFSLEEMRALTKICHAASDRDIGARRLHRWFSRERSDFLRDSKIGSPSSELLRQLYDFIVNSYRVKHD